MICNNNNNIIICALVAACLEYLEIVFEQDRTGTRPCARDMRADKRTRSGCWKMINANDDDNGPAPRYYY